MPVCGTHSLNPGISIALFGLLAQTVCRKRTLDWLDFGLTSTVVLLLFSGLIVCLNSVCTVKYNKETFELILVQITMSIQAEIRIQIRKQAVSKPPGQDFFFKKQPTLCTTSSPYH